MAEQCHLVYKTNFLEEIKYFRPSIGKRESRSFSLGIGAIVLFVTSFPGSLSYPSRDPGWVWSRVSKNLGDYKQTAWGRGG